jgi:uncharacterized protein YegJ (DUF2314 family)
MTFLPKVRSAVVSAERFTLQVKSLRFVHALILTAAFSAPPLFADTSAASNANALVPFLGFVDVTVGTHRSDVAERLGEPPDRFSPDVWVYWDYRDPRRAADERYQTLVIIFTGERVTRIRFTDTKTTRDALAKFRRDEAIAMLPHDPEMLAAIQQVRASMGTFLNAFAAPTAKQSSFLVKVAFLKDDIVEHIWLANLEFNGAKPTGTIAHPPRRKDLKLEQRVEIDLNYLSDWMYVEDGKLVGGFTTRLLRKRMTPEERTRANAESSYRIE